MSDGGISATSRVFVDEQGHMVDFSTTDRSAALPGGLTRARWITPIDGWSNHFGWCLPTGGHAIWHLDTSDFEYGHGQFVQKASRSTYRLVQFKADTGAALPGLRPAWLRGGRAGPQMRRPWNTS
jgi:hypothetical protein